LKISLCMVQRYCRGTSYNDNYILGFGPKMWQPARPEYPKYKVRVKKSRHKIKKPRKLRSEQRVNEYKNGVVVKRFDSIAEAAQHFGLKESTVKRLCKGEMKLSFKDYPYLKFGKKVKVEVG